MVDWLQAASDVVTVHRLRSQADIGGIAGGAVLDHDDRLCDIAADKQQVNSGVDLAEIRGTAWLGGWARAGLGRVYPSLQGRGL